MRPASPTTPTSRARAAAAATALGALALAGCVGIPTSGPINEGDVVVDEPGTAVAIANEPVGGADPAGIVSGFLSAGAAGLGDDFETARKFLTQASAGSWDPRAGVIVYPSEGSGPSLDERDDGTVRVTVPVEATIDAAGRYTEAASSESRELEFALRRNAAGEWRIFEAPDGVVMSPARFENLYRSTEIYFATPFTDEPEHLVPELRWFPASKAATSAVTELLAGPSPYLRDAVITGAPDGARLPGAVTPSEDGVTRIDLSGEANLAETGDRNLLQAQLIASLERIPGVTELEVTVGGLPWRSTGVPELLRNVLPESGPYLLSGDRLAVLDRGDVVPLEDAAPLTGLDAREPALSPDGTSVRVVLDGATRLILLPAEAAAPVPLLTGVDLVDPAVDRFGWIWTGERAASGSLTAVSAAGEAVTVATGAWLDGRTVRSVDVAADGARIAVVHADPVTGGIQIDVAGIVRDEQGRPELLSEEPLGIGAVLDDATEVAWVDETSVAVLGRSGGLASPTVHVLRVGGPSRVGPLRDGAVDLAARGDALFITDREQQLLTAQGVRGWRVVATEVRDPAFPG